MQPSRELLERPEPPAGRPWLKRTDKLQGILRRSWRRGDVLRCWSSNGLSIIIGSRRRCGFGPGRRRGCCRFVIALKLEEERRHLERHLVARIHWSVALGVDHVDLIVPRIGL